jgi:hypothetical protein
MEEHRDQLTLPRGLIRGVLGAALLLFVVGVASCRSEEDPPPAPPPPPLQRLHVIFPEGFTRREMADRVDAVRDIAIA